MKDDVTNQCQWIADSTKILTAKEYPGVSIVQKYFNIHDNDGIVHYKKFHILKGFRSLCSTLKIIIFCN